MGREGLLEKNLVLEVAQRLGSLLQNQLGCEVIYTRKDDNYVTLEQRAELANQVQADLFISVHANYSSLVSARGVETYYSSFFSAPEAREIEYRENANAQAINHTKLTGVQLKARWRNLEPWRPACNAPFMAHWRRRTRESGIAE